MTENGRKHESDELVDQARQALRELRAAFKVDSDSAVLSRAIALARIIAREAKDDHTIVIECKDGSRGQIYLDA